jgi:hypothetical protein
MRKIIKQVRMNELVKQGVIKMSKPTVPVKTFCVFFIVVSLVLVPGCITTPRGSEGTKPVITLPPATTSPAATLQPDISAGDLQLAGNVYGLSSDPSQGIDTIMFTLGLPAHASGVELTRIVIVFSAEGSEPVTLTQGTQESSRVFTTTMGGNAVTELRADEEVDISFRVKAVPGGTSLNIDVRPPDRAALIISRTVPLVISSLNVLLVSLRVYVIKNRKVWGC